MPNQKRSGFIDGLVTYFRSRAGLQNALLLAREKIARQSETIAAQQEIIETLKEALQSTRQMYRMEWVDAKAYTDSRTRPKQ